MPTVLRVDVVLMAYFLAPGPSLDAVENFVGAGVQWIRFIAETISVLIITIGMIDTCYKVLKSFHLSWVNAYNEIRFTFSRYLVMALEFELAADIIGTAISPTWDQLGKLAVIAIIRTLLNYFLQLELKDEKKETAQQASSVRTQGDA